MRLFLITLLGFCIISVKGNEHKDRERVASLIVLPPIVLGYDELYDDLDSKKPAQKESKNVERKGTQPEDLKDIKKEPTPVLSKPNEVKKEPAVLIEKLKEIKEVASRVKTDKPVGFKRINVPWDQLVAYDDPRGQDAIIIPQQRLVLTRTKDGKYAIPNNEWIAPSKLKSSPLKEAMKINEQNKSSLNPHQSGHKLLKREGNNETIVEVSDNKNVTLPNVLGKPLNDFNNDIEEGIIKDAFVQDGDKILPATDGEDEKNFFNVNKDKINQEMTDATTFMTPGFNNNDKNINKEPKQLKPVNNNDNVHISLPGKGVISDPLSGDILNFQGNFMIPHKLFDCPCAKNKS